MPGKRGQRLDDLGIAVAFVTSERLYDHQRAEIAQGFGCTVANGYGGRDAGFIAHECPQRGMHLSAEDIIVEIIDADGTVLPPGQAGEIVVTHLATRDFPFIRYRTGDQGILDHATCPCGRGLPLLKEIQGRSTDFVVAHDGTVMHGLALIYILRDLPEIAVVQDRPGVARARARAGGSRQAVDGGGTRCNRRGPSRAAGTGGDGGNRRGQRDRGRTLGQISLCRKQRRSERRPLRRCRRLTRVRGRGRPNGASFRLVLDRRRVAFFDISLCAGGAPTVISIRTLEYLRIGDTLTAFLWRR